MKNSATHAFASGTRRTSRACGHAVALIALLPTSAAASACAELRPAWDGRPATQVSEAIGLFLSPAGLFLLAALLVALLFRHQLGTALTALLWSGFVTWLVVPDASGARGEALAEGCIASPTLFMGLSAAICASAVFYTFGRETRL